MGEMFGKGLSILFDNFFRIFLIAGAVLLPGYYIISHLFKKVAVLAMLRQLDSAASIRASVLILAVSYILYSLISVLVTVFVHHRKTGIAAAVRGLLSRLHLYLVYLGISFVVYVVVAELPLVTVILTDSSGLGWLLYIPLLFLAVCLSVRLPAFICEQTGPFRSFIRSWQLSKGGRWRIFLVLLCTVLILVSAILVFSLIIYSAYGGYFNASLSDSPVPDIADIFTFLNLVVWFTVGFVFLSGTLLSCMVLSVYYSRKSQVEALGLEESVTDYVRE